MNYISRSIATTFLVIAACCLALGQSTDQANPTPLQSAELVIAGPQKANQQYYYSFPAGPGEVTLSISLKAKSSSTFAGIKVFDEELNTLAFHNMSAEKSPSMAKKTFEVGTKQTLLMSFTSDPSLGEFKIKFGGAVEFGSSSSLPAPISGPPVATDNGQPSTSSGAENGSNEAPSAKVKNKSFVMSILDAAGQRFNIPANGKLRIEMKDGSIQEIDLTQVKKILVKNNP